ncbi:hypothetical protein JA1_002804 [Spathaspora sp. JA1]|nr:hypothetical protein JA1_002804 [Spathaspora sp. JA1]
MNDSLVEQIEHLVKIVNSNLQLTTYQKHELTKLLTMTIDMIRQDHHQSSKYSKLVDSYRQLIVQTISPVKQKQHTRTQTQRSDTTRFKRHSMFEMNHVDNYISTLSPPLTRTTTANSMYRYIPNKPQRLGPTTTTTTTTTSEVMTETPESDSSEFDDEHPSSNTILLAHPRTRRPPVINQKLKHTEPEINPFQIRTALPTTPSKQQLSTTPFRQYQYHHQY